MTNLLEKHLNEAIKSAMLSFNFCPKLFTDKKGRLWLRDEEPVLPSDDVWYTYTCTKEIEWDFNLVYEKQGIYTSPDGPIRCSPYYNSGDEDGNEFAEFGCGSDCLTEADLSDIVDKCEQKMP